MIFTYPKHTSVVSGTVVMAVDDVYQLFPITKKFYAIHRNGIVTEEHYTSFTMRKSVSRGAKTDLIYGLPDNARDVVVFHMNTKETNTLRISRILTPESLGQLRTVPVGQMAILGVYPIKTKTIMLNIPEDCRSASAMEFLRISNIKKLFETRENNLVLSITKTSKDVKVIRDKNCRNMYSLTF